ncbi:MULTISPECIES: TOMM precursor leader peptide-binding protein [Clavibacter]|uniref:Bacteriocin biosynthesis cyclodehydratase n=2 Tax=Clavibacter TaxID=1573 RepID=A0A399P059_9MICO|nr:MULTISPECIES: TOMM precursor leader peptide-binding protein [Clavibacter]KDP89815.1 hypothetical protein W824_15080 [Clavibacter cf. michiganensis LMG 26808]RII99089.1 bacteriocin biosynthesis cyclodehydratase [Clavibacter michiganensis]UKF26708.1 TOMM precursor leader peptide-binding protein [Clavibacter sp. A6099]
MTLTTPGVDSWPTDLTSFRSIHLPTSSGIGQIALLDTTLVIGPVASGRGASRTACGKCVTLWHADRNNAFDSHFAESPGVPDHLRAVADGLTALLVAEPERFVARTACLDITNGTLTWHHVHSHPLCSNCGWVSDDLPRSLPDELDRTETVDARSWRVRSFDRQVLRDALVDYKWGPLVHLSRDEKSPMALSTSEALHPGGHRAEGGYGRSLDFQTSEVPAVLEGLERTMSAAPLGRRVKVHGSFAELRDVAVDPADLGLHDPRRQAHEAFALDRYAPDLSTTWVWAWSTLQRREVLIPAHVAYWDAHDGQPRFLYESSNGCALGGSLQEAILYGLFEVIERDAFLLAWHSRTQLREVDWQHLPIAAHISDRLHDQDMRLRVFDMTSELAVPASMAVIDASHDAVERGDARALNLAAGAHPVRDRSIATAIEEAATNALMFPHWAKTAPGKYDAAQFLPMVNDFTRVRNLDDHTGLFGLNEARPLWSFLDGHGITKDTRPHELENPDPSRDVRATLRLPTERFVLGEYLDELIAVFHANGLDVIVVDQTSPAYASSVGVHTVKVIVPGTAPMTFGHLNDRTRGNARVARGATLLQSSLGSAGVLSDNIPHPFP